MDTGELDGAMKLFKDQERICRELENRDGIQTSLGNQALILQARGDHDGAMKLLKDQERICRELGKVEGLALSLANQSLFLTDGRGSPHEALSLIREAHQLAESHGLAGLVMQIEPILIHVQSKARE
jgi:hypothetical protein